MEHQAEGLPGGDIPRTREGDEAHYTAFSLGPPPYLQAGACSMQRILRLAGASLVLCILQLLMTMCRLLGEFVDRHTMEVALLVRQELHILPSGWWARWIVYIGRLRRTGRHGRFLRGVARYC